MLSSSVSRSVRIESQMKFVEKTFQRFLSFFDIMARIEYSFKLFLSIFNLQSARYVYTLMCETLALKIEDADQWGGHFLKCFCSNGNGFWLVYEGLSIDFGRTILIQNRAMACKIGCGLFLSPQYKWRSLTHSHNTLQWPDRIRSYFSHQQPCKL